MAATIAIATGTHKDGRQSEVRRLGSVSAQVQAATWKTFASAYVSADGSGYVLVQRDGKTLHKFTFGPEDE